MVRPDARSFGRMPTAAAALFLAALGSCDSDPVVEPEPSLEIVPDSVTLTHIGHQFTFSVRVGGGPGSGAVRWSSRDTTVFVVDADGVVTARGNGTAGLLVERGRQWSQALVLVEQAATSLETVGNGQEAVIGIPLWRPVGVRLLDAGGTPVSVEKTVRFDASAYGGTANPAENTLETPPAEGSTPTSRGSATRNSPAAQKATIRTTLAVVDQR